MKLAFKASVMQYRILESGHFCKRSIAIESMFELKSIPTTSRPNSWRISYLIIAQLQLCSILLKYNKYNKFWQKTWKQLVALNEWSFSKNISPVITIITIITTVYINESKKVLNCQKKLRWLLVEHLHQFHNQCQAIFYQVQVEWKLFSWFSNFLQHHLQNLKLFGS